MNKPIIKIENLTKSYAKTTVVDNFSLSVEKGHIYGIIGPNGAGKTTIMKMLAGLAKPGSGNISLFGESKSLNKQRSRMSFMLEAPYLDPNMTAWENMMYIRYVRGVADKKRIDELLSFVGLNSAGKKTVKNFSLGMKQRLGIGIALMSDPEVMVLDEPINGLDPEGIVEIRNMFKKLCYDQGVTILISSHLLSELSELSTDFAIISKGKLIESFSAEELDTKCRNHITIKTNDINKTAAILEEKLSVKEYLAVSSNEIHLFEMLDNIEKVSKTITDSGLILTKLIIEGESLEEYYLKKVGELHE